jgi:hypothetical protein
MKKAAIAFILFIVVKSSTAQNIGIGTTAPSAKLQINHRNSGSSPSLILFDSAAGTGSKLLFSKQNQGTNFSLLSTIDILAANSSLDIRTTFASGIILKGDGKVGINNINPSATLHVGGGVKVQDTLHIVKGVKMEDSLHVSGDLNLEGNLKINGNTGNVNQVLVSNGAASAPAWTNMTATTGGKFLVNIAFNTNSIGRNGFSTTANLYNQDDTMDFSSPEVYNIGTDFTINTTGLINNNITINTTGLYHFEGLIDFALDMGGLPNTQPNSSVFLVVIPAVGAPIKVKIRDRDAITREFAEDRFFGGHPFQISRYLAAGTKLSLIAEYQNLSTYPLNSIGVTNASYFGGYRISD